MTIEAMMVLSPEKIFRRRLSPLDNLYYHAPLKEDLDDVLEEAFLFGASSANNHGLILTPCLPTHQWFHDRIWNKASALLITIGVEHSLASCLAYFGCQVELFCNTFESLGKVLKGFAIIDR